MKNLAALTAVLALAAGLAACTSSGSSTCRLGNLPELAAYIVMIQWRANGRSEDKVVILPECSGLQPVLGLAVEMFTERLYG